LALGAAPWEEAACSPFPLLPCALGRTTSQPWRKEGMEWNQWLKYVLLYRCNILYKGVEGEGRGCERIKIEKSMMVSSDGIEQAIFGLPILHSTTGPPGHVMILSGLAVVGSYQKPAQKNITPVYL